MILRTLTRAKRLDFEKALSADTINKRVRVVIRNQDEKPIGSLTADADWERARFFGVAGVIDGQVDVDMTARVTHQLRLEVSDPLGQLTFDKDHPSGGLFPDRLVSVVEDYWVEAWGEWQPVPTFWGPITNFQRDGHTVSIEALGKESLALEPHVLWKTMRLRRYTLVEDAITQLMRQAGERKFDFPVNTARFLHKDIAVARRAEPWIVAKRLANSVGRQLLYGPDGFLRLRRWPDDPVFTFTDGWTDRVG